MDLIELGNFIRNTRRGHCLTQQDVCDQVGCARIVVRKLEHGYGTVAFGTVLAIMKVLKLDFNVVRNQVELSHEIVKTYNDLVNVFRDEEEMWKNHRTRILNNNRRKR